MTTMRCGVAAVEALRAVGVSTIFGLMGSSTLEIYDALYDATDFTYIGVRHENCGMHMADAYGRVTQTPGVFICGQAGPGAANMVLGLAQARLAYAPVVVLTGLPATEHRRTARTVPALLTPLDCGMIGFSYAAGLGAKVTAPQRTVMSLMGDGGFGMTMGEMATAVMQNIATIAIVMDNGTWGSEITYQRDFYNQRYIGAHVLSPRFDEVMRLCGGNGYFATEPGDTADAVRQAMQDGKPAVIHVKVDPDAVLSFRRDALQKRGQGAV